MARYHTTGRARAVPDRDGSWVFLRDPKWNETSVNSSRYRFKPLVNRPLVSRLVLRIRRSRWLVIDVPQVSVPRAPEKWAVSVTCCRNETDVEVLEGAYAHVRAELEALETLVQWRRGIPVVPRPVQWSYRLPTGTHDPCVYFMRNGTQVKIGTTTQIRNRVRRLALRPENVALIVPGGRDTERLMHQRFASQRVGDTEWFEETGTLRDYIETSRMEQRS